MATIIKTLVGFDQQQTQAFNRACATWEYYLQDDVTIRVRAVLTDQLADIGLAGMCIPNFVQGNWHGQNITLTTAQGKSIGVRGFVTDPAVDILVLISSTVTFNYSDVENGNMHFETTILHELCHGLGFIGLCNVGKNDDHENIGIFSDVNLLHNIPDQVQPLIPFMAALQALRQGYPTPFATEFLMENTVLRIVTPMGVPAPLVNIADTELYTLFTTANSMHIQVPTNPNSFYKVFTITGQFIPFTSCDHINYANSLMYYTTDTRIITQPDVKTKNILGIIGWNINPN